MLSGADLGLALTGVAGPGTQEDMPVGTVCVAVVSPAGERAMTLRLSASSGREQIRQMAVISALDLTRRHLS